MQTNKLLHYLALYIPFIIAYLFKSNAHLSYLIAWLGSFFIFIICYKEVIKKLPSDLPIIEQLLRPVFFIQIIFAGYMSCTSIFYYLNTLGYEYITYVGDRNLISVNIYESIANCQRFYVLGHGALLHGILLAMRYPVEKKYHVYTTSISNLLLGISFFCLPISYLTGKFVALNQFSVQLGNLSFVAGTIALAFAIRERKRLNLWAAGLLFGLNMLAALSSGFKEPVIITTLLLGVFLLPIYGRKIIPVFGAILIGLFFVLPTFIGNFRQLVAQGTDVATARDKSIDNIINNDNLIDDLQNDNWAFLVGRLSEIDMFIRYTNSTPYFIPYYKTELVENSMKMIMPRFIWPEKPDVEQLVMTRVYNAGVVDRTSFVSAKPAYIVDCYLSYGKIGIIFGLFFYGFVAQKISQLSEVWFGGYLLGTAVMFSGLFQIFWRGNSFEFLVSAIFWSFITMIILQALLKARGILIRI